MEKNTLTTEQIIEKVKKLASQDCYCDSAYSDAACPKCSGIAQMLADGLLTYAFTSLQKQLPAGMQNCTILFEECPVGHGHLRGANWVKNPCAYCELNKYKNESNNTHHRTW